MVVCIGPSFVMFGLPVLNGNLKIDKIKILMTNCSLMKVESVAECSLGVEHSVILLTCIKQKLVLKNNFR